MTIASESKQLRLTGGVRIFNNSYLVDVDHRDIKTIR